MREQQEFAQSLTPGDHVILENKTGFGHQAACLVVRHTAKFIILQPVKSLMVRFLTDYPMIFRVKWDEPEGVEIKVGRNSKRLRRQVN